MEENSLNLPVEIVVIGGSAGSLEVLFKLLPLLRPDLSLSIIIILHRRNSGDSSLAELLSTKTTLPLNEVEDKDAILPGYIYLAPSDYHLLIEKDYTFSLDYSEKINFSRPSIDVTFESAADIYGSSMAGIILSGANEDGTKGLKAIKNAGGITIAQNPDTAQMPLMPQHAISHVGIESVLTVREIAGFINGL
ncbi:chemotaxis protein CheB [Dyadobacter sp. NIV53]|uniref:chemotaxis protein CheB n=1 Tax=Dyadobacter sp. NIV53 TaxID=2861765 RepID=UPI001C86BB1F|nr:chemotaxis protein CheB [Dyadobacter sp. NIV53]